MRWLANYLRQCLCRHDFEAEEMWFEHRSPYMTRTGFKVSQTCKRCGYHRAYWKF
jgi:hypothetical protein